MVACRTWHSTKWPMRAFAMTGMVTVSMISLIILGSDMRATPPSTRMSAGTLSSAMTAAAPASSAMRACERARASATAVCWEEQLGAADLLGVHDVHDDSALQHAGQAGLDLEVVGLAVGGGAVAVGGGELGGHCAIGCGGEGKFVEDGGK